MSTEQAAHQEVIKIVIVVTVIVILYFEFYPLFCIFYLIYIGNTKIFIIVTTNVNYYTLKLSV